MRVLLTGASSFTGFWFAKQLGEAGVEVVAALRGSPESYAGIRSERVRLLSHFAAVVPLCPFGGDKFLELVNASSFDVLCHHAAEARDYRSADFDVTGAVAANTFNLRRTLTAMREKRLKAVVATGSVFEPEEGSGPNPKRAFSPYGLSKGLTWQVIKYWCETLDLPLSKFVIANPFGAFEDPRFVSYVVERWAKGEAAEVRTPGYLRDNIHVELLARAYARFVAETGETGRARHFGPCGYLETQGAFAERLARELAPRLGVEGRVQLAEQTDFSEPLARVNSDPIRASDYGFDDRVAWDTLAEYWRRRGFVAPESAAAKGVQTPPVEILGAVDAADNNQVSGWLTAGPTDGSRYARILVDGLEMGVVRADAFRRDLAERKISDGNSGYHFQFARPLDPFVEHELRFEDRDTGRPCGPTPMKLPKLVGGPQSPFVGDRDFVGVSFGAAEYTQHYVDVLLETYGLATSFARVESGNASVEIVERRRVEQRYYEALGLDVARVKVRARPIDASAPIDIRFAEAAALGEVDRVLCENVVPARTPDYVRDLSRENIERVSGTSETIDRYAAGGMAAGHRIEELVKHHFGRSLRDFGRCLDWGGGCGRVALPLTRVIVPGLELTVADVDSCNIAFGKAHYPDVEFVESPFLPPLPFADGSFGAIYGVSVFTHLTESVQFAWLRELRRLTRPGAPVIVTVHSEFHVFREAASRPEILGEAAKRGISDSVIDLNLGPKLGEPNYYRATFHTRRYIMEQWAAGFDIVKVHTGANGGVQDIVVMRAK